MCCVGPADVFALFLREPKEFHHVRSVELLGSPDQHLSLLHDFGSYVFRPRETWAPPLSRIILYYIQHKTVRESERSWAQEDTNADPNETRLTCHVSHVTNTHG
jgi:hypothetical protein